MRFVVPCPLNELGADVDAVSVTDPLEPTGPTVQFASTRTADAPGDSVTDAGDAEQAVTAPVKVGVRVNVEAVDVF